MIRASERLILRILFLGALLTDQISKLIVVRFFPFGQPVPVLGNVLMIRYLRNPGTVFGMFSAYPNAVFWLKLIGLLILVCFTSYLFFFGGFRKMASLDTIPVKASLAMISASAIANFIDRVRVGGVIDFIDIGLGQHRWHTFNPADAYLVIGAILIIISSLSNGNADSAAGISGKDI